MTTRINLAFMLRKKLDKITIPKTITITIESLFIIQRTQPKTFRLPIPTSTEIKIAFEHQVTGPYGEYFERFNSQSSIPSGLQSPPPPPNFRISDPWEVMESEKEEEESENQEFTYQHPITENPEVETPNLQTQQNLNLENLEIKTPNIHTPPNQRNQNSDLIYQQNLPPVIVINQPPIEPISEPIQPLQVPPQQPLPFQQLQQQPPQQSQQPIVPMVYVPITKLEKFTSEEDDVQA
ncbi:hypothetical protein G9A89_009719 [Geosiphon pyriformis]|nr:hypothetical protein G9A89_009719 [Geosiphon pyriformis]